MARAFRTQRPQPRRTPSAAVEAPETEPAPSESLAPDDESAPANDEIVASDEVELGPATPPSATDAALDAADATGATGATEAEGEPGQGDLLSDDELVQGVSALIFASPEPLSLRRLAALLEGPRHERIRAALDTLAERLGASGLPLELRSLAGGWQILTAPAMAPLVQRLFKARKAERVSAAALETLAVVAYRQPVTKAEIEAIRGVQAGPILRTLIDRGLVRVTGRSDQPGHALQYGTTKNFLDRFGLGGLDDLPRDIELARD